MRGGYVGLLMALTLVGTACRRSRSSPTALPCGASDSTGAVRVVVRESSGRPVPRADVHDAHLAWTNTDDQGRGCLTEVEPGSVRFSVSRIGFHAESLTVRVIRGAVADVAVTLRRADPPCCRLEGAWHVRFEMERPSGMHQHPAARSVEGIVVFSPKLPSPTRWSTEFHDPVVRYEYAHTSVDFSPLFGGRVARDVSTTIFGAGGETLFREVLGMVPAGDSVTLTFIPRMSHGSMWLGGRIAHDTIRGRWTQSAYCCGAAGRFEMHRIPSSPEADSLIASGLRAYAREEREARAADSARQRRIGWLRVRVYDEAVHHYIAASFWTIRAAHDPARSLATLVYTADTGWGEYRDMEPGVYDTYLSDFACGRQTYFADSTYVRQYGLACPVTVRTGERLERDVRTDSRRITTEPLYENREGKLCNAKPSSR